VILDLRVESFGNSVESPVTNAFFDSLRIEDPFTHVGEPELGIWLSAPAQSVRRGIPTTASGVRIVYYEVFTTDGITYSVSTRDTDSPLDTPMALESTIQAMSARKEGDPGTRIAERELLREGARGREMLFRYPQEFVRRHLYATRDLTIVGVVSGSTREVVQSEKATRFLESIQWAPPR
jgi:hypothetical protein